MDHPDVKPMFAPSGTLAKRIGAQRPGPDSSGTLPTFYRNLEDALDVRRDSSSLFSPAQNSWQTTDAVDFCSNDLFSWNTGGVLRAEFLAEVARNPDFNPGSGGARLIDGNYPYIEKLEREIAEFHGAETGLILNSAYSANLAIWTAIPRPGDVILYDPLVHASTYDGISQSLALERIEFPHNNVEGFRKACVSILDTHPQIKQGRRSILVAVESIYGMEGGLCPLQELVDIATELTDSTGNIQFVVDEVHATGILGPTGTGLACELGLEKQIAIIVHGFSKALGSCGAIVLGNATIRNMLTSFSRTFIFTTSPSFPFAAAIKAGYTLLQTSRGREAQQRIQTLAELFFQEFSSHPLCATALDRGLLAVPALDGWEERPLFTHIVSVFPQSKHLYSLYFHLLYCGFCVFPMVEPAAGQGQERLKITFHAGNTTDQVQGLVKSIFSWAQEMLDIEDQRSHEQVPRAAKEVYAWMKCQGLTGFGMG